MNHKAKHNAALNHFVRNECAQQCRACSVIAGHPCRYFERAVLGPPDYPHRQPGYDYAKLFEQYGRINPKKAGQNVTVRHCACGEVLAPRERVCAKCRAARRKATYRTSQRKRRLGCVGVNS